MQFASQITRICQLELMEFAGCDIYFLPEIVTACKNADCSTGKTKGVLRGGASKANRGYLMSQGGRGIVKKFRTNLKCFHISKLLGVISYLRKCWSITPPPLIDNRG